MAKLKIIVIGLDGATFDLLKPWAEKGKLPNIKKLLEQGTAGKLRSTIPPMTAPAWTSFMTGKNPGKHGLYDWIYRHQDSYEVSPSTAHHNHEPAVWDFLSRNDLRVCLLNIPMTFPPKPVNGYVISGMPAPSKEITITYPQELLSEVEAEVGEYLLYPDPGQAYSDSGVDSFLKRLYKTTKRRLETMAYLREKEDWDFFMVVFNGTDTVQHAMWKFMSPEHPLHDDSKFGKYGNSILNYYQFVDKEIGKIVNELDDQTVLMLMSDHGFGPFHKFIHVNNWLIKNGWMNIKRNPKSIIKSSLFNLGFSPMQVYDLLMRFGLGSLKREVVRGKGQGLLKTLFLSFKEVDWSRTRAYSLGNVGQIFLNVRGREPQGMIEPGENYQAVREEIIEQLMELRDPETGEKVVQDIYRKEEIYQGSKIDKAADIIFIPTRMEYFGFGEYEFGSNKIIESMKHGISGTHRLDGIFILWGKPINQGVWIEDAKILDLAPTILYLLSQPIPEDMDGIVLDSGITDEFKFLRTKNLVGVDKSGSSETTSEGKTFQEDQLTGEDEEIIIQRLRDLGYVG